MHLTYQRIFSSIISKAALFNQFIYFLFHLLNFFFRTVEHKASLVSSFALYDKIFILIINVLEYFWKMVHSRDIYNYSRV